MGVAAAQVPATATAARAPIVERPPLVLARSSADLLQRSCDCGGTAGLSGHCAACDRTDLGARPAGVPGQHNADEARARASALDVKSAAPGARLSHDLGRLRIVPASPGSATPAGPASPAATGIGTVRHSAPVSPQTQLRVSSPGDAAEREAHSMAQLVMRVPEPLTSASISAIPPVAPNPAGGLAVIHRRATGEPAANADALARLADAPSAGMPLPQAVRSFMETRFGADFSGVRVHADAHAAALSGQLSAQAFTVGREIYFGGHQFQPNTQSGRELIAHELTHTIQQGGAAQRAAGMAASGAPARAPAPAPASPAAMAAAPIPAMAPGAAAPTRAPPAPRAAVSPPARVAARTPASVQRLGLGDAWSFFADKTNLIPGFRMLTILLGVNPLTMAPVDRSAANVLRAIVEFLPGGGIIVQALQNSGVFEKVGAWVSDQISTLSITGAALRAAANAFLGTLKWSDILDLGGVWERAKRIFTEPIDRLIAFVKTLVAGILKFIKDAILLPLAKLAEGTRGWDLLIAVLGKNPITGDPVARTAETLIGGFLKLIGQDEIWDNMKKSNAIGRAWTWFQGAMAALIAFVSQIPDLFVAAFKSLTIEDVVLVAGAFQKVGSVFGGFLAKFTDWAGTAIWNLLEIIFDVVSPGALSYIKKTGAALKSILKNPLPFVGNLVKAAKLGFENFASHFGTHLKEGLIDWLTGSLPGVYIPKALSLVEFGKFALSVLGITWAQIRGKIVKALGPTGETIMKALETTFDVVVALVKGGPAAAWELIKEKLSDLKDTLINGIKGFVVDTIVEKAVPKLISLFVPGAGFISAILSIYDTVMVFVQKLAKIAAAVKAFVDSIVAIAAGQIEGAAAKVESTLAGLLSLAISFLAGFLGLGNIASKVMAVITKVRATVDKAIDAAITWLITKAKALFAKLFGKGDPNDTRTDAQKQADLSKGIAEADALLVDDSLTATGVTMKLPSIQRKYKLATLSVVTESKGDDSEVDRIEGTVNPPGKGPPRKKAINLPAISGVKIDHIVAQHTIKGGEVGQQDLFPLEMDARQIEALVRLAYKASKRTNTQPDQIEVEGSAGGLTLRMYVNIETKKLVSAFPLGVLRLNAEQVARLIELRGERRFTRMTPREVYDAIRG